MIDPGAGSDTSNLIPACEGNENRFLTGLAWQGNMVPDRENISGIDRSGG
jgi:hypothetical protein